MLKMLSACLPANPLLKMTRTAGAHINHLAEKVEATQIVLSWFRPYRAYILSIRLNSTQNTRVYRDL